MSAPDGLTLDNAPRALELYERAKAIMEKVKDNLEAFAERNGGSIPGPDGKVWRKVVAPGGESFDAKAFKAAEPELAKKYTKKTGPRSMGFRWTKS
jgi:hypothetical protein